MIIHALTCTTRRTDNHQGQFTRLHAPTRKSHTLHASRTHMRPSSVMMSWWRHSPGQPHLTRSLDSIQTAWKKKKKVWPSLNFDLDQKVKIFKIGPSHSVFWVHSDFGIHYFIQDSEIVQMAQFLKVDFCINLDQKSTFSKRTCLAQFFA